MGTQAMSFCEAILPSLHDLQKVEGKITHTEFPTTRTYGGAKPRYTVGSKKRMYIVARINYVFNFNGVAYKGQSYYTSQYKSYQLNKTKPLFKDSTTIEVLVNPRNPNDNVIKGFRHNVYSNIFPIIMLFPPLFCLFVVLSIIRTRFKARKILQHGICQETTVKERVTLKGKKTNYTLVFKQEERNYTLTYLSNSKYYIGETIMVLFNPKTLKAYETKYVDKEGNIILKRMEPLSFLLYTVWVSELLLGIKLLLTGSFWF